MTSVMAAQILADEVSHDQIYITMITVMVAWPTALIGVIAFVQARRRAKETAQDKTERMNDKTAAEMRAEIIRDELIQHRKLIASDLADSRRETASSLKSMHGMLNSEKTAQMEIQRDAILQAIGATEEVIAMKLSSGEKVLPESYAAQAALDAQLEALNALLADRKAAQAALDAANETANGST